jgi:biotin transporter BioY
MKIKITTKQIAITAIFAAIYAVFRIIPLGPMIGLSASFSLSDSLAPLFGIILGPYLGGLSVIIGTFSAMALGKAPIFLGLDFLPGLI